MPGASPAPAEPLKQPLGLFLTDKATSQLLLETDWESILQICDMIRQGDTQ